MARILRFSKTMAEVRRRLRAEYPDAKSVEDATNDVNHTLWMIAQISTLDSQRKVIAWYNWILAKAHSLGLFDIGDDKLTEIRGMARRDVKQLRKSMRELVDAIFR